ncbi:uncharacterized protein LOC144121988 [Amblyomma americanum]
MPLVDTPFRRVAIDIIGPLKPTTRKGHHFILTIVDYETRFPEAVALPSIETERKWAVGCLFTSRTTSPYHPMANGLVERLNWTLKKMLRRMCTEQPKEWDRFIEPLLFAYREVPQEYDFGVESIKEKNNVDSDYLSRV